MELEKRKNKMTSLELLEVINKFRKLENQKEKQHKHLLRTIRNELTETKIEPSNYTDKSGKKNKLYILNYTQAKIILMGESKTVRFKVIEYIEKLENELEKIKKREWDQSRLLGKASRILETNAIKRMLESYNISEEKQKYYYISFSKLPYILIYGSLANKPKRDEMNQNELILFQQLEAVINLTILENINNNVPVELIYSNCKEKGKSLLNEIRTLYIEEVKNEKNALLNNFEKLVKGYVDGRGKNQNLG